MLNHNPNPDDPHAPLNRPQPVTTHICNATRRYHTPQSREQSNQPHPKYPDLQLINPEIVAANTATKQKKTLRTLYNDNHPTRPAPATTRRATMARRLPSPPPRSRRNAQAARANDPLDENRLDADHRRATNGLRGRRHPRQPEHSRARVLVE